jgi:uncharacterized membrane protein HdeD (DUF308 family)
MSKLFEDTDYQAFRILQITFIIAPVVAGLDKFFNLLTNWSHYIAPFVSNILHHHDQGFMMFVGCIEVIAGIGVYFRPKIFAYVVSLWLLGIIFNLLLTGEYFDIALRDLGLSLAALALGRLSQRYA